MSHIKKRNIIKLLKKSIKYITSLHSIIVKFKGERDLRPTVIRVVDQSLVRSGTLTRQVKFIINRN